MCNELSVFSRSEHSVPLVHKQCLPVSVAGVTLGVEMAVKDEAQRPGARVLAGGRTCPFSYDASW